MHEPQSSALLVQAYAAKIRATKAPFAGALRQSLERRAKQAVSAGRRFSPMRSSAYLSRALACHLAGLCDARDVADVKPQLLPIRPRSLTLVTHGLASQRLFLGRDGIGGGRIDRVVADRER